MVVYGESEKKERVFKLKNLKTGDERTYTMIDCFGAIVFHDHKVLLVKNHGVGRGFPKGHAEGDETLEQGALRELEEETGIKNPKSLDDAISQTSYFYDDGRAIFKTVYYKHYMVENDAVTLQTEELAEYRWVSRNEALKLLSRDMHHLVDGVAKYFS